MNTSPRTIKVITWLVAICLLVGGTFVPSKAAELGGLQFSIEIDPTTMTSPGNVKVTARLSNSGTADIQTPLALFDPDDKPVASFFDGGTLAGLKVGETQVWTGDYSVSQAQLDAGKLIYTIKAGVIDAQGTVASLSLPAEATINYVGEKVSLTVKRTISPEVVRKDETVKVIYELINDGNVQLNDIRIREHSSISTKQQSVEKLEPQKSVTITFEKKISGNDLQSHPNITYLKQGDKKRIQQTLDQTVIPVARPNLRIHLSADQTMVGKGDKVVLTVTLENQGNITYFNVSASDEKLGIVFSGITIPAKETVVLTKEITLQETQDVKLKFVMEDNTGSKPQQDTNQIKLSAYDPEQLMKLDLVMSSDRASIATAPGEATFTLRVTNNSSYTAKRIKIYQGQTEITTIDELAAGQSTVITRNFMLSQGGKFQFTAEARDAQNNTQTFLSNEMTIPLVPATQAPTPVNYPTVEPLVTLSPVPENVDGVSQANTLKAIRILAIAFGVLFAVALLLLVASTVSRMLINYRLQRGDYIEASEGKRDYTEERVDVESAEQAETETSADKTEPAEALEEEVKEVDVSQGQEELPHQKYLHQEEEEETVADEETPEAPEAGAYRLTRQNKSPGRRRQ